MHVTTLQLKNWRNFPDAEVHLQRRAFFVGPNASGKSNLLDALKFLRDLVLVGGGLQEAVRRRGGVSELRSLSARRVTGISVAITIGDESCDQLWTYELEFSARKRDRAPEVTREVVRQGVEGKIVLNRPNSEDERDSERLTQTALEQVAANKTFRDVADFLESMRYLHVVPQIVRDPQRSIGRDDPFGGDLIERINAASEKTRKARLKRMEEALRIAVPQMRSLELEIDKKGVPHLHANYAHWRPQGAWQREDRFSDGTLRLLGLVWSLQERGGPLLLEEPELSLNSAVVSQLAPLFARATRNSKRQVLVTTHSAELLSNNVRADEAFVLTPTEEGTEIALATTLKGIETEVAAGLPLGELLTARTRIKDIERLPLLELMTQ